MIKTPLASLGLCMRRSVFLGLLVLFIASQSVQAQWTTSGSNINNTNSGNVGIGTASPDTRLSVVGAGTTLPTTYNVGDVATFVTPTDGFTNISLVKGGIANPQGLHFGVNQAGLYSEIQAARDGVTTNSLVLNRQGGNVGIGTASPDTRLSVVGAGTTLPTTYNVGDVATFVTPTDGFTNISLVKGGIANPQGLHFGVNQAGLYSEIQAARDGVTTNSLVLNRQGGNVGIGTSNPANKLHVAGSITVDGNINAKYQDVAEWVSATRALPAGTVVTLNPTKSNFVEASSKAYDTRVAGVISAQPGIVLGERAENKVLVATTGRVKIKVDATNAAIEIGDLLVTSEKEGVAMKSVPVNVGGVEIHRPGTLIGKALEPLAKGQGEILVLLSLQ